MTYETIQKIVIASGVTAGEQVLIHFWGDDKDKEIANDFMIATASVGASPILLQQSREINKRLFSVATDTAFNDSYFEKMSSFDAVLDVFTYQPITLGCEIEQAQFTYYRRYIATLFSALMKSKRFAQIRIPTVANAQESALDPQNYIERMTKAYDIDYQMLKNICENKATEYRKLRKFKIKTASVCELTFCVEGREWYVDAGNGDIPCGEIYIAPLENKTNGKIFFEKIYVSGVLYENVVFTVENGKVVFANDSSVNKWFSKLADNDRIVCELGFGMNPNVGDLCGYTVLDEKMLGTFHIAVGANNMFGGNNISNIHEDFVCTSKFEIIEE